MTYQYLKIHARTAVIAVLGFMPFVSGTADNALHNVVDGLAVYFGVLPAEMIRGHPKAHHESRMHGGVPTDWRYHLTVSIFDNTSGERVTTAEVTAKVVGRNGTGPQMLLEAMTIAGKRSYGNYFKMPGDGPYRIQLQIRRPGIPRVTRTAFEWGRS